MNYLQLRSKARGEIATNSIFKKGWGNEKQKGGGINEERKKNIRMREGMQKESPTMMPSESEGNKCA